MKLDFFKKFDFFTGVPDSLLKPLCDYLINEYGIGNRHIVAANEGNAVALAAGYHLATGKVPLVYMQNSGIGNIINPVASLMNDKVYGIPCVFVIGWRGEPNVADEPQHIFQGETTLKLLEDMDIATFIISKDTTDAQVQKQLTDWESILSAGKQVALVVKKGALQYDGTAKYGNLHKITREDIIRCIVDVSGDDTVVSTTGKASRELFEIRKEYGQGHSYDFLTVGSMGHSSSIALGITLNKPNRKIWCVDGDGGVLMHMGAMAVIGVNKPQNLVHIVINNGAHETVGGMPTVADKIDFVKIALGCGYPYAESVDDLASFKLKLTEAKKRNSLSFIEIKCGVGSRSNLGRPTTTPKQNKVDFMKRLSP